MKIIRNYSAEGAIGANLIAKAGSTASQVVVASANTDNLLGLTGAYGQAINERIDVQHFGLAEVKLGGSVAFGDRITADSAGKGVKATDAMIATNSINTIGIALAAGSANDTVPILVIPEVMSKLDGITASAAEVNKLDGAPLDAGFTIGEETTNAINVAIQLKDGNGADIAVRGNVKAYLSDDANGDSIVGTAPDGGVAIGTDGLAIPVVASKAWLLTSESDGDIDLTITHAAGAKTVYLILVLPNGKLKASTAITFA
jgi:hypothetical protein